LLSAKSQVCLLPVRCSWGVSAAAPHSARLGHRLPCFRTSVAAAPLSSRTCLPGCSGGGLCPRLPACFYCAYTANGTSVRQCVCATVHGYSDAQVLACWYAMLACWRADLLTAGALASFGTLNNKKKQSGVDVTTVLLDCCLSASGWAPGSVARVIARSHAGPLRSSVPWDLEDTHRGAGQVRGIDLVDGVAPLTPRYPVGLGRGLLQHVVHRLLPSSASGPTQAGGGTL